MASRSAHNGYAYLLPRDLRLRLRLRLCRLWRSRGHGLESGRGGSSRQIDWLPVFAASWKMRLRLPPTIPSWCPEGSRRTSMLVVSGVSPCLVVVDERRNLMSWFSLPAFWWWARVLGPMAACEAEDFAVGGDGIKRGGECEWDARDATMLVGDGLRMSGRVDGCDGEERGRGSRSRS